MDAYDEALSLIKSREDKKVVRNNIASSFDVNPDQQSQYEEWASELRVPVEAVASAPDMAKRRIAEQSYDFDKITQEYPSLASQIKKPSVAKIVYDDVDNLMGVEDTARTFARGTTSTLNETGAMLQKQAAYMAHVGVAYGVVSPEDAADIIVNYSRPLAFSQRNQPAYMREYNQRLEDTEGSVLGGVGLFLTSPQAAGRTIATQFPNSLLALGSGFALAGAGTTAGGAPGGLAGLGVGSFAGGFVTEMGATIDSELGELGFDPLSPDARELLIAHLSSEEYKQRILGEAQRKGVTTAGVDALFSLVGGRFLKGLAPATTRTQKVLRGSADVGVEMTGESLGEGLGQYAQDGTVDLQQAALEGLSSVGQSVGQTGIRQSVVTGRSGLEMARDFIVGNKEAEIRAVHDAAKKTKTASRKPGVIRDIVEEASEGRSVYIDAQAGITFFQNMDDEQRNKILAEVPYLQRQLDEAIQDGEQFEISNGDYYAHIATSQQADQLIDHVRFSPADYSIDDFRTRFNEIVDEVSGKTIEELEAENQALEDFEEVQKSYETQLMNVGYTPDQAKTSAVRIGAAYRVFSERYGSKSKEAQRIIDSLLRPTIESRAPGSDPARVTRKTVELDDFINRVRSLRAKNTDPGKTGPMLRYLRQRGIKPGSFLATELGAMDIGQRTLPGLIRQDGSGFADNIPRTELADALGLDPFEIPSEDGTYADQSWILEQISTETPVSPEMTPEEQFAEDMARAGYDLENMTNEEVRKAMAGEEYNQSAINSEAFQNWFGDSKVVDENGDPLVVYHGTSENIESFNTEGRGKTFDTGAFFSDNPNVAATYATGQSPNVNPVYLSLQNPVVIDFEGRNWNDVNLDGVIDLPDGTQISLSEIFDYDAERVSTDDVVRQAKFFAEQWGADGAILQNVVDRGGAGRFATPEANQPSNIYVAFEGGQIKSPFNRGTFDRQDTRTLFQARKNNLGLFSSLEREVENMNLPNWKENKKKALTPEMKEKILSDGMPFFQDGKRGAISFDPLMESAAITLFEKHRDASTLIHEEGHLYWKLLERLTQVPDAETLFPEALEDLQRVRDFVGAKEGEALTVEQEEKIADGFLKYVETGKAPSVGLRDAFRRFSAWLRSLYAMYKERRPDVNLNKNITDVFDRMLATDAEIELARSDISFRPDENVMGLMDKQSKEKYLKQAQEERERAYEEALSDTIKALQRENKKWYQEEIEKLRDQAEEQVNSMPVYRLEHFLRTGEFLGQDTPPGVVKQKLSRKIIKKVYGEGWLAYMPRATTQRKGGSSPDILAEMFGFDNGFELLESLANMEKKQDVINRLAEQEMVRRHGDPFRDGTLERTALENVYNDERIKRMEMEYNAVSRYTDGRSINTEMVKQQGRERVAKTPLNKLNIHNLHQKSVKYAREFGSALAQKNYVKAAELKRKQILAHTMFSSARKAKDLEAKTHKKFKKVTKADLQKIGKTRDSARVAAAQALLGKFSFGNARVETALQYFDVVRQNEPDTYEDIQIAVDVASQDAKDYRNLTPDELADLRNAVENLWESARRSRQVEVDGKLEDLDEVRSKLVEQADSILAKSGKRSKVLKAMSDMGLAPPDNNEMRNTTDRDKSGFEVLNITAALRRVEFWVDVMDGGDPSGVFRSYIWNPIKESINNYRDEKTTVLQKYLDIVRSVEKDIDGQQIAAPELGGFVFSNMGTLLHAIIHTGNRSNKEKLLIGYEWGTLDEDGNLDDSRWQKFIDRLIAEGVLEKRHMDFAQEVWNLNESLKPAAQKAHRDMYGYYFNEITADPIETPWGTYRGGYAPAIADVYKSNDAAIRQNEEEITSQNNSFMFPSTGAGFRKNRVENYYKPLALDLRQIPGHLDKVLRFTHIEPHIKDVARITMRGDLRDRLDELNRSTVSHMITPWLQRSARQAVESPTQFKGFDQFMRTLRKRSGMSIMIANVTNTLQQFTGVSVAMTKVSGRRLRDGLLTYTKDPTGTANFVNNLSSYMRNRTATQMFEVQSTINDLLVNPSKYDELRAFADRHGYFMQVGTQNIVDHITWLGAYNQAVERGANDKDAIREADSAVRQTQGSFDPEDLSRFETGAAWARTFTMFYSYFNMIGNLNSAEAMKIVRETGFNGGAGKLFYVYFFGFALPAIISEAIVQGMGGDLFDDEDDESWVGDIMDVVFGSQVRFLGAMVPIAGPSVMAAMNAWNDKWYDDRISTSPVVSMIESTARSPNSVYKALAKDGSWKRAVKDTLTATQMATGVPTAPLGRPLGYVADVAQGREKPEGPIDFTRGLIVGR